MNKVELLATRKVLFNHLQGQCCILSEFDFVSALRSFKSVSSFLDNYFALAEDTYSYLTLYFQNVEHLPLSTVSLHGVGYDKKYSLTTMADNLLGYSLTQHSGTLGSNQESMYNNKSHIQRAPFQ